jgi:hypothetical protein
MTIPVWPSALPQNLQMNGYQEEAANLVITSQPDIGPAKIRRRSTAGVRPVKGNLTLTKTQLQTLLGFYNDDLLGGALRFSWEDPVHETSVEMRFVDPPGWTSRDGYFDVDLSLEILP